MRQGLKRAGGVLTLAAAGLLLAPTVVPPFLDRVYYRGPASDHFDGKRFFNPYGEGIRPAGGRGSALSMGWRMLTRRSAGNWPDHVAVTPGYPPAAATPCPARPAHVVENWARCVARVDPRRMFVTWIGHATVLVQVDGLNILTDPVWSDRVGPWGLIGPRRVRPPGIRFDDLPKIDLVLVSHDHYDHMDLATLRRLWARDRPLIVTSLGNDMILRGVGVPAVARDWGGRVAVSPVRRLADGSQAAGVEVIVERVHHWGSRWGSDRNRALWSGFTVRLSGGNLFFAGDTGRGDGSWMDQAARDGPFRLALLPIGAFKPRAMMSGNHIGPLESVEAFERLRAAYAMAIHWGTFRLSEEGIEEPKQLLATTLAEAHIAPDRFRAIEVGKPWEVPPIQ